MKITQHAQNVTAKSYFNYCASTYSSTNTPSFPLGVLYRVEYTITTSEPNMSNGSLNSYYLRIGNSGSENLIQGYILPTQTVTGVFYTKFIFNHDYLRFSVTGGDSLVLSMAFSRVRDL